MVTGQHVRQPNGGGFEQLDRQLTGSGDAVDGGAAAVQGDFLAAQRGEPFEALFDGDVEMRPCPSQRAHDQIGQHDHQDVAPRAVFGSHIDGPDFQVRGSAGAKGALDFGKVFVAVVDELLVGDLGRQASFDDVAAVQAGLGGQGLLVHAQAARAGLRLPRAAQPAIFSAAILAWTSRAATATRARLCSAR